MELKDRLQRWWADFQRRPRRERYYALAVVLVLCFGVALRVQGQLVGPTPPVWFDEATWITS